MSCRNSLILALAVAASACHPRARPAAAPARPAASRAVSALQTEIDTILAAPALQRGYWGVLVRSLDTDETLYAANADKLMMPASNMKIITLAVAAERLGWGYTYETTLLAVGTLGGGTLDGDLVVVGSGDPSLTDAEAPAMFDEWASRLRAAGIERVGGRLVGDDRAFDQETLGMGWSWDDLADGYATGVGALQYNQNVARVVVSPAESPGQAATVSLAPIGSGLAVTNHVTTLPVAEAAGIALARLAGSTVLDVRGSIAVGSPPRALTVSVANPTLFFANAARAALAARGIAIQGPAVDAHDIGDTPPRGPSTPIATRRSPPLSTLAATMMKASQNLYAETLLKTLGAGTGGPATIAAGRRVVDAALASWHVPDGSVVERDGSGLSRYNYVTPAALVAVLAHVDADPELRGPFMEALPTEGVDGTLASRGKGTAAAGRVHAKTGSMANVRALSGYTRDADGEPLAFAILANNFDGSASAVTAATDAIVLRLCEFKR
jgi:D-alanyl-D-alanine carboxypeptidase/D-alanyl-D-alanine-endopeptidase (penicillin-binding protein 4)